MADISIASIYLLSMALGSVWAIIRSWEEDQTRYDVMFSAALGAILGLTLSLFLVTIFVVSAWLFIFLTGGF